MPLVIADGDVEIVYDTKSSYGAAWRGTPCASYLFLTTLVPKGNQNALPQLLVTTSIAAGRLVTSDEFLTEKLSAFVQLLL